MTCLTPLAFALFLSMTGLDGRTIGPLVIVQSHNPLAYLWTGTHFCTGGVAL